MSTDKEHHGAKRAIDKIEDAVGALVGGMSAALAGADDKAFAKNAALADLYQMQAADIAKARSPTRAIRAFADKMSASHMRSSELLIARLGGSALMADETLPPAELDARRQGMVDNLEAAPDDHFDATYLDQQAAAHEEARTLFENYARNGEDSQLRAHALAVLPSVDAHARAVAAIRATV